jgi:hypothetical protein
LLPLEGIVVAVKKHRISREAQNQSIKDKMAMEYSSSHIFFPRHTTQELAKSTGCPIISPQKEAYEINKSPQISPQLENDNPSFFFKSISNKNHLVIAEASNPAAEARFPYLCHLGSSLSVHACYPRGVLPVCWACRVFSGFEN